MNVFSLLVDAFRNNTPYEEPSGYDDNFETSDVRVAGSKVLPIFGSPSAVYLRKVEGPIIRYPLCGHDEPMWYIIAARGRKVTHRAFGHMLCPNCAVECLRNEVIPCAQCGLGILNWEPVVLYDQETLPRGTGWGFVKHVDDRAVGCMQPGCAPEDAILAGIWVAGHFVDDDIERNDDNIPDLVVH